MSSFAGDCERPGHAGDITKKEAEVGILPSHGNFGLDFTWDTHDNRSLGISLDVPGKTESGRPPLIQHL